MADFQTEIIENNELRLSKLNQLDRLEEECTQLLGQANLTLAGLAKNTDLDYEAYEEAIGIVQNWFVFQKLLVEVLYKLSDLRYTLHFGAVSREQCSAILQIYIHQVQDTQYSLASWHNSLTEKLKIDIDKIRRKRVGIKEVPYFFRELFDENYKYRSIDTNTAHMIRTQTSGENALSIDNSELYSQDVQLIAKDGKNLLFTRD